MSPVSAFMGFMIGLSSLSSFMLRLLPQQLRQPRDVDGDPPRLVFRENLRLQCFVLSVARVDVCESLSIGVANDIAARNLVWAPGRRKTSGHHSLNLAKCSRARTIAGLSGFLTLSQSRDGPDR